MYFSDMFCYGESRHMVGITGIMGCMGFVYIGNRTTYALHVPPDKAPVVLEAGQVFTRYIKNNEPTLKGGVLLGFINGKNRPTEHGDSDVSGEEEIAQMKKSLHSPKTRLHRIMKHLGAGSGGFAADSVAIMVERTHTSALAPDGYLAYYKRNNDIQWDFKGLPAKGTYSRRGDENMRRAKAPSELFAGWRPATTENCTITSI